ncbi:hypothetical protein R0131_00660 [Clostridium sp. AL.422]|uniref:hypothetical protein n=1 Tax=Clostridium TaxID=1485 RepID=UPI00293DB1F5|nr:MULTISPECIES: hypothetical protein [unclassified Clostridium]MDV4149338.1 hypothetical protein [Clostridium sp. AL.422]
MGKGISIQCKKCGYSATIFEGRGSRTKEFDSFIKILNKNDKEYIKYIVSKGTTEKIIYHNDYGKCNRCGDLSTINYVEIKYDKDKVFILDNKCHNCEGIYKPIKFHEVKFSSCPICNNEKFESFMYIDWD